MSFYRAKIYVDSSLTPGHRYYLASMADRIRFVINCSEDSDWAVRKAVRELVSEKFTNYKKVLEQPDKYRLFL